MEEQVAENVKATIREMEEKLKIKSTAEDRFKILHEIDVRKNEIAASILQLLKNEEVTVNDAISILDLVRKRVMNSRL